MIEKLKFQKNPLGELVLELSDREVAVVCKPSFPWSSPLEQISVVDSDGEILAVVEDPFSLEEAGSQLVLENLENQGFLFEVDRVEELTEEFELRHWRVETRQGPRCFQTALENWPRRLPDGSFLVEDLFGDVYRLKDVSAGRPSVEEELDAMLG